jgi:Transglycosylase SLT domain
MAAAAYVPTAPAFAPGSRVGGPVALSIRVPDRHRPCGAPGTLADGVTSGSWIRRVGTRPAQGGMLNFRRIALTLGLLLSGVPPVSGVLPVHAETLSACARVARAAGASVERVSNGARVTTGADRFAREMRRVGRVVGVDPSLLRAVVMQESSGNPAALSEAGAVGLTQLMPVAIRQYAGEAARLLGRPVDARAAFDNLLMGALYYRDALRRTSGDVEAAARLYHGGPNLALHGPRTMAYGRAVAWRYRLMTGSPACPEA